MEYVDDLVVGTVRDVHGAVARRAFGLANRGSTGSATLAQTWHDRISRTLYAGLGAGMKVTSAGLGAAERRGLGPRLEAKPSGRLVMSAVNGLTGDRLAETHPDVAITMSVRRSGSDVQPDPEHLSAAFPEPTADLVIFLHGLGENDDSWRHRSDENGGTYGDRLAADTSWTPVYLRANTGLPIAENGVALASLIGDLVGAWPAEVRRIALVGHSMGGLIIRAACAVATEDAPWNHLVTNVVTLGSPHLGAPLEKTVNRGARVLGVLPETAPFGRILEYRSIGILNLGAGLAADVQNLPHARYHLVAATLNRSRRHPVSMVLGDLMVRYPSALGRPRRGPEMFPDADVLHVPETGHFALLNHADVYESMKGWLG